MHFEDVIRFLVDASGKKKPATPEALQNDLAPIGTQMGFVADCPTKCPPRDVVENHLTAVAEAINMLSWVSAESRLRLMCRMQRLLLHSNLNKVLSTTKGEEKCRQASGHTCRPCRKLLAEMKVYIKEHHTMGRQLRCRHSCPRRDTGEVCFDGCWEC